jgi:trk system potassium uptake protein TrkH
MGVAALAMLPPVFVAMQASHWHVARSFFYASILLAVVTAMLALTLHGFRPKNIGRSHLITLVGAYLVLPMLFALPFQHALRDTTVFNAYYEMVSAFTTTGGSTFDPARLVGSLHLWRAEVAWLGGLFAWITAAAIFAPLNLGGFEVSATSEPGRGVGGTSVLLPDLETSVRLIRVTQALVPVYAGLTLVLWTCLIIAGDGPLPALVYAMSTLSTSGITLASGTAPVTGGLSVELLILLFLVFALSRRAFATEAALRTTARLFDDPEMRMGVLLIAAATAALFLRHFVGSFDVGTEGEGSQALYALWGSFFTVVSFLTTTGFVSEHWVDAQNWSGLTTPGFALLGLAMIGGGVATTAGGVKLLRVYALFIHGRRELGRLLHPSLVSGTGRPGREVPPRGVYIAWLFFMLFALSIALIWVLLAITGLRFDDAMILTVAALSTTGPLAPVVSDGLVSYAALEPAAKTILMAAMILGRLETLAIIALLNVEFWRG